MRFSPYCWRAKLSLAHKGLDYTTVATPFTKVPKVEDGVSKTVPVINDSGKIVADSFAIALYLDENYPEAPTLFAGEPGIAAARFFESWALVTLHPIIMRMMVKDIYDALAPEDQAYFRPSREARLGRSLEKHQSGPEANAEALRSALAPVRSTLTRHEWLSGPAPRFPDYVVFGSLMWLNTIQGLPLLPDDPVLSWFGRCRELYDTMLRGTRAA